MADEFVVVLTTMPHEGGEANEAEDVARALVEERLAACVNLLGPMVSTYRWEGAVERETERQMVIKTSRARVTALWERLRELHPYDVPEFVVVPVVDGSDAYLKWIGDSTTE